MPYVHVSIRFSDVLCEKIVMTFDHYKNVRQSVILHELWIRLYIDSRLLSMLDLKEHPLIQQNKSERKLLSALNLKPH